MILKLKFWIKKKVKERTFIWYFLNKSYGKLSNIKRLQKGELPDFIVVGAQKAGTSALFNYLVQHSSIIEPAKKEVHYFDLYYNKGINWYKHFFPSKTYKKFVKFKTGNAITGEATPIYSYLPRCLDRIKKDLPNVKIIFVMRNPIDRAFSHYHMNLRKKRESLSFEEAIEKEKERLKYEKQNVNKIPSEELYEHYNHSYLERGEYFTQIKKIETLFPKKQILILDSEELKKDTNNQMQYVFKFLGVNSKKDLINPTINPSRYGKMEKSTREKLNRYFEPFNKKLYNHLKKDFGWK